MTEDAMRTLATLSAAVLLLAGCSQTTAFDFFKMDAEHERAVSNMRTATLVRSFETKAIISAVYLNRVKPETYSGDEHFYVSVYLPKRIRLFDKEGKFTDEYALRLNGADPVSVKEVDDKDPMRTLMPVTNDWNRYYIVSYTPDTNDTLTLTLESGQYGQAHLTYRRDVE